jgi:hypothetical protein
VVTINSNGLATGVSPGTSQVTASASGVTSSPDTLAITAPPIVITPATGTLPSGSVSTAYTSNITATGGLAPYTFSLDAASAALPAGLSFSSTASSATISGTPTATGTTIGIIVDVKDSESPALTQTVTYSIAINACGAGSEALLNGQYAFLLKGLDSSGNPALVGGVMTVDGAGQITAGALDMNLNSGVQSNLTINSGSSYSVGSDHRGCMAITTSAGTQNYRFSLANISSGVASTGHMIDFDTTGPFTAGVLRKQDPTAFSAAQVTGTYAFGGSSVENAAGSGGKFAIAGVIGFDGAGGITGGTRDDNQNGTLDGNAALTAWPASSPFSFDTTKSSYSIGANGRGTLVTAIVGQAGTSQNVLYVVSSAEALFMSSDPQPSNIVAGEAFQQSGGPFSTSSLSGKYITYYSSLGSGGTATTSATLNLLDISAQTFNQVKNDGGTITPSTITAVTFTVASTGRAVGAGGGNGALLYLVSPNQAFFLNRNLRVGAGFVESQTGSPFSNSSAIGTFALGTTNPDGLSVSDQSAVATFDGTSSFSATSDNNFTGSLLPNHIFGPMSYSVDSTGLGLIPANCSIGTTCQTIFYIISPTKAVVMNVGTTNTNPSIQVSDQ